jgi:hypothetical protein
MFPKPRPVTGIYNKFTPGTTFTPNHGHGPYPNFIQPSQPQPPSIWDHPFVQVENARGLRAAFAEGAFHRQGRLQR